MKFTIPAGQQESDPVKSDVMVHRKNNRFVSMFLDFTNSTEDISLYFVTIVESKEYIDSVVDGTIENRVVTETITIGAGESRNLPISNLVDAKVKIFLTGKAEARYKVVASKPVAGDCYIEWV